VAPPRSVSPKERIVVEENKISSGGVKKRAALFFLKREDASCETSKGE